METCESAIDMLIAVNVLLIVMLAIERCRNDGLVLLLVACWRFLVARPGPWWEVLHSGTLESVDSVSLSLSLLQRWILDVLLYECGSFFELVCLAHGGLDTVIH